MRTFSFNAPVARHLHANFRAIDKLRVEGIELSLCRNYFVRFPSEYLSTDWGKQDLENHLSKRLEMDRKTIIPWLDKARPLRDSSILEIGCGTGCSTVALAEQGAKVTAIDVDDNSLVVAGDRCRAYGLDVSFAHANATDVDKLFSGRHFDYIIFYAALEHMTVEERMSAMRASWQMLADGDLWCVIETPIGSGTTMSTPLFYHSTCGCPINWLSSTPGLVPDRIIGSYIESMTMNRVFIFLGEVAE